MLKEVADLTALDVLLGEADGAPILLDLWAPWCGPCKAQAPVLERLAADTDKRLRIVKLDVEANPDANQRFAVRGIPLLILFIAGKEVSRRTGTQTREQLRLWMVENRIDLGLATDEHGKEVVDPLGGAFYGDEGLRMFLMTRVKASADQGKLVAGRFPEWAGGKGTIAAAIAHNPNPQVFERVTGLPIGFGAVLDFVQVTERSYVEMIEARMPAGADVRGVPLRFVCNWLSDSRWNWPELVGADAAAIKERWLSLVAQVIDNKAVSPEDWKAVHDSLESLVSDDPMLTVQRHFVGMLLRLTPAPSGTESVWSPVLAIFGFYVVHARASHDFGMNARHLSLETLRHQWFTRECPNPREKSREEMDALRARFNDEHAEFLTEITPGLEAYQQRRTELHAPRFAQLRDHLMAAMDNVKSRT